MSSDPCFDEYNKIIDLTCSSTRADHRWLTNVVINLDTDESIIDLNSSAEKSIHQKTASKSKTLKRKATLKKDEPNVLDDDPRTSRKLSGGVKQYTFGDCPICWDELGKNRLASTKCGHVFCHKCLKHSLKLEKRCPTCRKALKSKSDYHPLYLSSE